MIHFTVSSFPITSILSVDSVASIRASPMQNDQRYSASVLLPLNFMSFLVFGFLFL